MTKRSAAALGLVVTWPFIAACAAHTTHRTRIAHFSALQHPQAGLTPAQESQLEGDCGPFGRPAKDPSWDFGPTVLVIRDGYALEHSSSDKIPLWVCEGVVPEELTGSAVRRNKFAPEPLLAGHPRSELADYKGSGRDRGHQAPAGNQSHDQKLKDETFFLSNMAPQVPAFNQRIWAQLEDLTRDWVRDGKVTVAHISTGGLFYDPAEENPATADGFIEFSAIGPGQVAEPTHFYKVVVGKDSDNSWRAIGFVIENRSFPAPFDFTKFIQPIDWIEERTGLDFMPELPPDEEKRLERLASPLW